MKMMVELSSKSIQENKKILERIQNLLGDNIQAVTEQLMYITYFKICEAYNVQKLSNHIDTIKYELINGGKGFRIQTSDWVVFFNEYGTGIYNDNGVQTDLWTYYKDGKFYTTEGQKPKHIWRDIEQELKVYASDLYNTAISYALDQKSYSEFAGKIIV